MAKTPHSIIADQIDQTISCLSAIKTNEAEQMCSVAKTVVAAFAAGNKILLCGNGGSAADCQHLAAEFMVRFRKEVVRKPLPAIALTTDTSFLTAFINDIGNDEQFSRQVETLGKKGDILWTLSTSGSSKNIIRAIQSAQKLGMIVIGFVGAAGWSGAAPDYSFSVPSTVTAVIQQCHLTIEHLLCELIEDAITGRVAL